MMPLRKHLTEKGSAKRFIDLLQPNRLTIGPCKGVMAMRRFEKAIAAVWLLFIVQQGCADREPITSWDSPGMLAIQSEWESLPTTQDKSQYEVLQHKRDAILKRSLSHNDLRQLATTCTTLPIHENDRSLFTRAVLDHMVEVFVALGDRDGLVTLLSIRCPSCIRGNIYLEYSLVSGRGGLRDPVLILGEAYFKCQIPEVRQQIAAAVRRGFTSSGISGDDDAVFVETAMRWYEKETTHLVVNQEHHPFGSLPPEGNPDFQVPPYEKFPPLFVEKRSVPDL